MEWAADDSAAAVPASARPDPSRLVTEDDTPVDNWFQEKQLRLLVEPLYSSWKPQLPDGSPRTFVAGADVGIFSTDRDTAIVPDVLLSMDVELKADFHAKENCSYYGWLFGKMPEIVIEIVSNKEGDELEGKRVKYSRIRIANYVVYDPKHRLSENPLQRFELRGDLLVPAKDLQFPSLGLELKTWEGEFEGHHGTWLRWFDHRGPIPSGRERAETEKQRAETEKQRAETEKQRAETEKQRAETEKQRAETEKQRAETEKQRADALAEKLRALGGDPEG